MITFFAVAEPLSGKALEMSTGEINASGEVFEKRGKLTRHQTNITSIPFSRTESLKSFEALTSVINR